MPNGEMRIAASLADYYHMNEEQKALYFTRVQRGEKAFYAIDDFLRWNMEGNIEAFTPEKKTPSQLGKLSQDRRDTLYGIFVELLDRTRSFPHDVNEIAAEMVMRVEGFLQYNTLEDQQVETCKYCPQRRNIFGGKHSGLCTSCAAKEIDEEEEKPVCYLTGGEPGGNCDCYECGIANEKRTGISPEQASNREDERRMSR